MTLEEPLEVAKFGAIPSPRNVLAASLPFAFGLQTPSQFINIPPQISFWGNNKIGNCATAEEAFAKGCGDTNVFVPDSEAVAWANRHNVADGAIISDVLSFMQNDGFILGNQNLCDGPYFSVDWTKSTALKNAISNGPVKIGVAGTQLRNVWTHAIATSGRRQWIAVGFQPDENYNHCVSLCGYGSINYLAQQLNLRVPPGINGNNDGYAVFTWNSIGIIDFPSLLAITCEAWVRQPTTVVKPIFPIWQLLDNNPASALIAADVNDLYQMQNNGKIWRYTGTPMTGWQELDNNPATRHIAASGGNLYQMHSNGKIWRYTGTPMTGWQELDNNPATTKIVADGNDLYQMYNNGKIWRYTGTPMTGWQELDNNPATRNVAASGGNLYQIHSNGKIWRYTGTPMTGWQELDNNPATTKIVADGNDLYQMHNNGKIWRYTGTPMTGWQELDNNPATRGIASGGGKLYQIHASGSIFRYTGPAMTGWQEIDRNPASIKILASVSGLWQLHKNGKIWKYTG